MARAASVGPVDRCSCMASIRVGRSPRSSTSYSSLVSRSISAVTAVIGFFATILSAVVCFQAKEGFEEARFFESRRCEALYEAYVEVTLNTLTSERNIATLDLFKTAVSQQQKEYPRSDSTSLGRIQRCELGVKRLLRGAGISFGLGLFRDSASRSLTSC